MMTANRMCSSLNSWSLCQVSILDTEINQNQSGDNGKLHKDEKNAGT